MYGQVLGRDWDSKVPPVCPHCGDYLRELTTRRCPECGYAPTFAELREAALVTSRDLIELKSVSSTLNGGVVVLVLGYAGYILLRLASAGGAVMLVGLFCGLGAVGCGLQVFRARRLPVHAVELLPQQPNYARGAAVATLGGLLMAISLLMP